MCYWTAASGVAVAVPQAIIGEETAEETIDDQRWAKIPAGRFLMGSPEDEKGRRDNEGPQHQVNISVLQCMRVPVTHQLYREVLAAADLTAADRPNALSEAEKNDDKPVTEVSWFDAIQFCNQWSLRDQLQPCYQIEEDEAKTPRVTWQRTSNGYRLPTEAEWEYLARAGTSTRYSFGDEANRLGQFAWYADNSNNRLQAVGQKEANPWGLLDMHGNVWEWCWDWYDAYSTEAVKDPIGPVDGDRRILRGGAFDDSARVLRSAFRDRGRPTISLWDFGFRCVRGPLRQP